MNTLVFLFNKANMFSHDQDFLTDRTNYMGKLGAKFTPCVIHTPLPNLVPRLGNITDGDKVHVEITM